MSEKSTVELRLEALESYAPMYHMITLAAEDIIPIDSLPPGLIRSLLHYVAGDICLYEKVKKQARESN